MNKKPLIIVPGEPYSVFLEIFFRVFKKSIYKKYNRPIILIGSKNLIEMQMKKMKYFHKINLININQIKNTQIDNKKINLVNVKLNFNKPFGKITNKSSKYISESFNMVDSSNYVCGDNERSLKAVKLSKAFKVRWKSCSYSSQ